MRCLSLHDKSQNGYMFLSLSLIFIATYEHMHTILPPSIHISNANHFFSTFISFPKIESLNAHQIFFLNKSFFFILLQILYKLIFNNKMEEEILIKNDYIVEQLWQDFLLLVNYY